MSPKNLTYQKNEWQSVWERKGILTAIVNLGRDTYNWFFRSYLKKFITRDTRFLEVGCGTATLTLSLAPLMKEFVGLDISTAAIELSRKHAEEMGVKNSTFVLGDCLNLPYTNEFDVVWSQGLMEHFEHPEKVASEHYKSTKPGGITIISIPYKYSYHALWYVLTRPKLLRRFWPWTDIILIDKKRLLEIGKKLTPKARVRFLQPFILGIIILELPK
jgi:2-polyprenyl-3-methyl-5-hydroxy-6-metoxy-1,4-benzoquinol methylase